MTVVQVRSSIKGYHKFKRAPPQNIHMEVTPEANNDKDEHAMTVTMPSLDEIPGRHHQEITKVAKRDEPAQRVIDVAGKMIGRVPANLCKLFRQQLLSRDVAKITCLATGAPKGSKRPPLRAAFKRNVNNGGLDKCGGGIVVPCIFFLHCSTADAEARVRAAVL